MFPWRNDTLVNSFGIVKTCFPSKHNVDKNIHYPVSKNNTRIN